MASSSRLGKDPTLPLASLHPELKIPKRATQALEVVRVKAEQERSLIPAPVVSVGIPVVEVKDNLFERHPQWLSRWKLCTILAILGLIVVLSAGMYQRTGIPQVLNFPGGQSFPIQLGGSMDVISTWQNTTGPVTPIKQIPTHAGPYSVLGTPSLSADFINQVLTYYHSPAAGKGQALYDYGVKYGIDPAFALAFFMHESTFGTKGVATVTLSLGNMRCIPSVPCYDYNGGYAQFSSWEQGFEEWYKLIRNLYVARWGLVTVDQIIPTYAPTSDHNDEAAYIASLKHALDTWHAGIVQVS